MVPHSYIQKSIGKGVQKLFFQTQNELLLMMLPIHAVLHYPAKITLSAITGGALVVCKWKQGYTDSMDVTIPLCYRVSALKYFFLGSLIGLICGF